MINVRKCCTPEEKESARRLFMEYQDVVTMSYKDLKSFMDGKIKHHIHLKPKVAPFQ